MADMDVDAVLKGNELAEEQQEMQKRFDDAKRFIVLSLENTSAPYRSSDDSFQGAFLLWDSLSQKD